MMSTDFQFEELNDTEKKIFLSAFGYHVNDDEEIVDSLLNEQVISSLNNKPLKLKNAAFMPGSLKIIDSDPLTISAYLREHIEK